MHLISVSLLRGTPHLISSFTEQNNHILSGILNQNPLSSSPRYVDGWQQHFRRWHSGAAAGNSPQWYLNTATTNTFMLPDLTSPWKENNVWKSQFPVSFFFSLSFSVSRGFAPSLTVRIHCEHAILISVRPQLCVMKFASSCEFFFLLFYVINKLYEQQTSRQNDICFLLQLKSEGRELQLTCTISIAAQIAMDFPLYCRFMRDLHSRPHLLGFLLRTSVEKKDVCYYADIIIFLISQFGIIFYIPLGHSRTVGTITKPSCWSPSAQIHNVTTSTTCKQIPKA